MKLNNIMYKLWDDMDITNCNDLNNFKRWNLNKIYINDDLEDENLFGKYVKGQVVENVNISYYIPTPIPMKKGRL